MQERQLNGAPWLKLPIKWSYANDLTKKCHVKGMRGSFPAINFVRCFSVLVSPLQTLTVSHNQFCALNISACRLPTQPSSGSLSQSSICSIPLMAHLVHSCCPLLLIACGAAQLHPLCPWLSSSCSFPSSPTPAAGVIPSSLQKGT